MFCAKIVVKLKKHVKNPEAKTLETVASRLDMPKISEIDCAKLYTLKIDAQNQEEATTIAKNLAEKVLANPIIEEFEVIVENESSN